MHCVSTFSLTFPFLGTLPSGTQLLLRVDPKRRKAKLKLEIGKNFVFESRYIISKERLIIVFRIPR